MARGYGKYIRRMENKDGHTVSSTAATGQGEHDWYYLILGELGYVPGHPSNPTREDFIRYATMYPRSPTASSMGLYGYTPEVVDPIFSAEQERVNPPSERQALYERVVPRQWMPSTFYVHFDSPRFISADEWDYSPTQVSRTR